MTALTMTADTARHLQTDAWLLRGISSIPGELRLQDEWLSFTTHDTGSAWPWQLRRLERTLQTPQAAVRIDAGEPTVLFRWPVHEVTAWCPWYYFSGGMKFRHRDVTLAFGFGRPANTRLNRAGYWLFGFSDVTANLREVFVARGRGKAWLAALAATPSSGSSQNHRSSV